MPTFAVHVTHRETGKDLTKPLVIDAETPDKATARAASEGWLVRSVEPRSAGAGSRASGPNAGSALGTLIAVAGLIGAVAGIALMAQDGDAADTTASLLRGIRYGVAAVACSALGCFGLLMCLVARK